MANLEAQGFEFRLCLITERLTRYLTQRSKGFVEEFEFSGGE
ncbi:hypothetical protein AB9Q10_19915 [Streptomyces krungchingensis]